MPGTDDPNDLDDIIEVTVKLTERNNKPQTAQPETKMIRLNNLPDIKRDTVLRGKKMVARLLSSHVQFVDRAAPDLQAAIAATGAGRAKGECTGVTMRYVAVIFASSTFGESASRPRYRLPPLSPDSVRKLLEAARGRFDAPADADREIDEGGMFLLFDGGRPGVETSLVSFFSAFSEDPPRGSSNEGPPLGGGQDGPCQERLCWLQLHGDGPHHHAHAPQGQWA